LTLIGGAAVILIPMRNWPPSALISLCILILLITPWLRELADYNFYWIDGDFEYDKQTLSEVLLGFVLNGYFPLLPWLIFPLAGFALGQMFYRNAPQGSVPSIVPLLGVLMIVLALVGVVLGVRFQSRLPVWIAAYHATAWPENFHPATTVFLLGSLGACVIALWVLNRKVDLNEGIDEEGRTLTFLKRYSTYAFSAYVAHVAFTLWLIWIVAWWQQRTRLDVYLGKFVSLPAALACSVIFIAVFYAIIIVMEHHKKYSLEYFMRWISS
jgi:hypothetical protein